MDDYKVQVEFRKKGGGTEMKEVTISEAIQEVFEQTMLTIGTRLPNPMWHLLYASTGKCYAFNDIEKLSDKNCAVLRQIMGDYVRKRKSGEAKSQVGDNSDMLSLFLQSPDIFTEEVIIDELIDFLVAGSQTTQFTTQTMLAHFATNRASLERVRAEFNSVVDSPKDQPIDEVLRQNVNMETCNELTYLGYVIQESLRINPIAPMTSPIHFEKDVTIGGLHVKAYDPIMINHSSLQRSAVYWQEPEKFNPNRFDESHPDSKTPEGTKRP